MVSYSQFDKETVELISKIWGACNDGLPFLGLAQLNLATPYCARLLSIQQCEINNNFLLNIVCLRPAEYAKTFTEYTRLAQALGDVNNRYYYVFIGALIGGELNVRVCSLTDLTSLMWRLWSKTDQSSSDRETSWNESKESRKNNKYQHFNDKERFYIWICRKKGFSQKSIAKDLGRSPSTISREVRRLDPDSYGPSAKYSPDDAQLDYEQKHKLGGYKGKIAQKNENGELATAVIRHAIKNNKLSPRQVANSVLKSPGQTYVSCATIYRWVRKNKIYDLTYNDLRRKEKKYKKSYNYSNKYAKGRSITERPEEINNRKEFGHFEADSILSSREGSGRLFTLVERKTRYTFCKVVQEGTAEEFFNFIKNIRYKYGDIIKSITVNRGSEFACWEKLERMGIEIYFCRPYNPNDKGQIEHMNGELRWFFPKKTDFSQISQRTIYNNGPNVINNFPRKVLNWRTSKQAFFSELDRLSAKA